MGDLCRRYSADGTLALAQIYHDFAASFLLEVDRVTLRQGVSSSLRYPANLALANPENVIFMDIVMNATFRDAAYVMRSPFHFVRRTDVDQIQVPQTTAFPACCGESPSTGGIIAAANVFKWSVSASNYLHGGY